MATLQTNSTLPDSSNKQDFYDLVENSSVINIGNADISASAAIAPSKLAQITTASKVSGAALTSLTSVPSAAGVLPIANIPSSIPYSKLALTGAVLNADLAGSIADSKLSTISTSGKVSGAALTSLSSIPSGAGVIPAVNLSVKNIINCGSSVGSGLTAYIGSSGGNSASGEVAFVVPFDGTLKRLFVNIATGSSSTIVITARKNGSDQSLTVSYADTEQGIKSDTSNTVSYSAGDLLEFKVVNNRGASQLVQISCQFDPA
jgi:hypothetical protein